MIYVQATVMMPFISICSFTPVTSLSYVHRSDKKYVLCFVPSVEFVVHAVAYSGFGDGRGIDELQFGELLSQDFF